MELLQWFGLMPQPHHATEYLQHAHANVPSFHHYKQIDARELQGVLCNFQRKVPGLSDMIYYVYIHMSLKR